MTNTLLTFLPIIVLFLLVLAVLWFLMPFAIFGTKPILRDLLRQQQQTTQLLAEVRDELKNRSDPTGGASSKRLFGD